MDGVLKSWAVTRGPSLVPGEKRLAVHVEDHPLEYGDFEGTIPKGEYGGGTVIVWDRGTLDADRRCRTRAMPRAISSSSCSGEKLRGRWHLVRMAGKPREKRENWLLIKGEDDAARATDDRRHPRGASAIGEDRPRIEQVAGEAARLVLEDRARSERAAEAEEAPAADSPARGRAVDPQMQGREERRHCPTSSSRRSRRWSASAPSGERWLHEIKFDGYRLQARIEAGRVKLLTRSGLDWTTKFGKDDRRGAARRCRSAPR